MTDCQIKSPATELARLMELDGKRREAIRAVEAVKSKENAKVAVFAMMDIDEAMTRAFPTLHWYANALRQTHTALERIQENSSDKGSIEVASHAVAATDPTKPLPEAK